MDANLLPKVLQKQSQSSEEFAANVVAYATKNAIVLIEDEEEVEDEEEDEDSEEYEYETEEEDGGDDDEDEDSSATPTTSTENWRKKKSHQRFFIIEIFNFPHLYQK